MFAESTKAALMVSKCHRVLVERGENFQPLQAVALRLDDNVRTSSGRKEKLLKIELVRKVTKLLDPDQEQFNDV